MLSTQEYLFWGNAEGAESEILVPSNAQSPSQVGEITKKEKEKYESSTKIQKSMD